MGVVERRHYISKMAEAVKGITPRQLPSLPVECRLSGLEPLNINVGGKNQCDGSAKFKRLIKEENYQALDVARQQVENGAQIIDINMDEGMLDPMRWCVS